MECGGRVVIFESRRCASSPRKTRRRKRRLGIFDVARRALHMKAFIAGIYSYRMRCNTHFYCCAKYPDAVFIWNSCVDAAFAIWDDGIRQVCSLCYKNRLKTRVSWLIRLSAVSWRVLIKQKRTVKIRGEGGVSIRSRFIFVEEKSRGKRRSGLAQDVLSLGQLSERHSHWRRNNWKQLLRFVFLDV